MKNINNDEKVSPDMAIEEFPNGVATDGNGPFKLEKNELFLKDGERGLEHIGFEPMTLTLPV